MYQSLTLSAGVAVEFSDASDFFRLMSATPTDISVIFYRSGQEVSRAENIGSGYAEYFAQAFDKMRISSAAGGAVAFVTRLGNEVRYDTPPTGNVAITNVNGAFTQADATVTNASGTLIAANATRRYLLIQNNDSAGDIYVRLDGATATTTNGFKVAAGGSLEITGFAPTGAIKAIGSIASNANVITAEG